MNTELAVYHELSERTVSREVVHVSDTETRETLLRRADLTERSRTDRRTTMYDRQRGGVSRPSFISRTSARPVIWRTFAVLGSTPQVTFPPGAGHDRYEENFNGPATYAEPYVERYGIKSDFSGREPLHPTPPRPGYVPTLGQTPPSSTQGSVMMVYGLQPDKVNTDKLFNLFCLYGNVTKVGGESSTPSLSTLPPLCGAHNACLEC